MRISGTRADIPPVKMAWWQRTAGESEIFILSCYAYHYAVPGHAAWLHAINTAYYVNPLVCLSATKETPFGDLSLSCVLVLQSNPIDKFYSAPAQIEKLP